MAYNLDSRFPRPRKYFNIFDPGAFDYSNWTGCPKCKKGKNIPFLSSAPRNIKSHNIVWTDKIYTTAIPHSIPNATSLKSKTPRFPYEALSEEDIENLLCRCGIDTKCECPVQEEEDVICQGKVPRIIYKGPPPHSIMGAGLSAPSKGDRGFAVFPDNTTQRLRDKVNDEGPPIYDARLNLSTDFYKGCKWSAWTSKRMKDLSTKSPGPADYTISKSLTPDEICAEKVRAQKRATCKQLRYIEIVQRRNVLENRPGPATYSPKSPRGTQIDSYGPKADRFVESLTEKRPGPADHWIRRDFDLPLTPLSPCHAKLSMPPSFLNTAVRFKPQKEEGPSPASYYPKNKICKIQNCSSAPFGSSAVRFKASENVIEDDDSTDDDEMDSEKEICAHPTWEFKSKTKRLPPVATKFDEPSPADLVLDKPLVKRSKERQEMAPFDSSEARFQKWFDWMPVFDGISTPGPCYYSLKKPRCYPAFKQGPLYRTPRFPRSKVQTPAPNEYYVDRGIETILSTHNDRLKNNINNQHKFHWEPRAAPLELSYEEKEAILFKKCISILDKETKKFEKMGEVQDVPKDEMIKDIKEETKSKYLQCFLNPKIIQQY